MRSAHSDYPKAQNDAAQRRSDIESTVRRRSHLRDCVLAAESRSQRVQQDYKARARPMSLPLRSPLVPTLLAMSATLLRRMAKLAVLACVALPFAAAVPIESEAADLAVDGFRSVHATLQAVADRLKADPIYERPRFSYSPKTATEQTSSEINELLSDQLLRSASEQSSVRSSPATDRFLARPNYVWDRPSGASSSEQPAREQSAWDVESHNNFDSKTSRSSAATTPSFNQGDEKALPLKGVASSRGGFRAFMHRTWTKVKSRFAYKAKPVDSTPTPDFSFRTPHYPFQPAVREGISPKSSDSVSHPFSASRPELDPKLEDIASSSSLSTPSNHNYGIPERRKKFPTSFIDSDGTLAKVAEGLKPLRVPLRGTSEEAQNRLKDVDTSYTKSRDQRKLQAHGQTALGQAAKPPKTAQELEDLSRLYFSRTGNTFPALQLTPVRKKPIGSTQSWPEKSTLYFDRKGRPSPMLQIPEPPPFSPNSPPSIPQQTSGSVQMPSERVANPARPVQRPSSWLQSKVQSIKALLSRH